MNYRTKKVNIVLLGGMAGVGKTTAANYLFDELSDNKGLKLIHTSFATPIKELAIRDFGWDGVKDERGRRLLQVIGTDAGRVYDENIWVKHMENFIMSELPYIVFIDDWRFPNEKSYFNNNFMYDILSIRIQRDVHICVGDAAIHPSELALPHSMNQILMYNKNSYYNFSIFNDGTIEEYYKKLNNVLDYLKTKLVED